MESFFTIKIDGKNIEKDFPIFYVETFLNVNRIPYCTIKIQDLLNGPEKLFANEAMFKIGAKIEVEFGENKEYKDVFKGILTKKMIKMDAKLGKCFLEIQGKDKCQQMTIVPKYSTYSDKTDADVIKEIISQNGLSAKIGTMSVKHESITQYNITDWDFINLRAEMYGFVIVAKEESISIDTPKTDDCGVELNFGENIISFNLEIDGDHQIEKSSGKIWDIPSQEIKEVTGEDVAEKSFGDINFNDITKQLKSPEYNFLHDGIDEEEIKTIEGGLLKLNRLSKIHGTITIPGNNNIDVDKTIKISKSANNFNGKGYISGVQNIFSEGEWVTIIHIGLNGRRYSNNNNNVFNETTCGVLAPIHGLKYGTVVKLEGDPKNIFRVFVNIPLIHKKGEGIWCRLSTFYASKDGGIIFFPEENDEVVVGFIESDPRSPIILGSLYNSKNTPSVTVETKNEIKKICTKTKMEISFDEKDKIITLQTPGECKVTISDKDESIEISKGGDKISLTKGALNIKCSKDISLDGNNINLKAKGAIQIKATNDVKVEGMNANIKGSMAANVEGGTSANLKSSGMTAVKGSMVNIN